MATEADSSNSDFIEVYPSAIPADLCERLIKCIDCHPRVQPGRTGHGIDESKKLSRDLTLDHHAELLPLRNELLAYALAHACRYFEKYSMALMGAVAMNVADSSGAAVTLTPDNYPALGLPRQEALVKYLYRSGTVNVQQYPQGKGGYPHWHSEQFPQQGHNEALHRVVLYMFYLNDVAVGGETEFFYQRRRIQPTRGTMVIAPAGFTHTHRGNIPQSNDKYIATSWIMFNRAEQLYRPA